jgi:toxin-antitoxin system PIN domain toxin
VRTTIDLPEDLHRIALVVEDHVHHEAAEGWLASSGGSFATCPITEGSLIRLLIRHGQDGSAAQAILVALTEHPRHEFWPDNVSYRDVPLEGIPGHRQVTDAYLVQLTRARGGTLLTLDRGLAGLYGDIVELIPTT